ncbi:MAG: DUF402 domain-containing protein [Anaerolineales bacterium]
MQKQEHSRIASAGRPVTVHKMNSDGDEVFRYRGTVLHSTESSLTLEAIYELEEKNLSGLKLRPGDRFVETHYSDRWYNVLAVYDVDSGKHKGWYCNITRPAHIVGAAVLAEDLALDLVVFPDGTWAVLDEDEFSDLEIDSGDRENAEAALRELQCHAVALDEPFTLDART